jgi:hypothetical protein
MMMLEKKHTRATHAPARQAMTSFCAVFRQLLHCAERRFTTEREQAVVARRRGHASSSADLSACSRRAHSIKNAAIWSSKHRMRAMQSFGGVGGVGVFKKAL